MTTERVTYHGVEVPVWEERITPGWGEPPGFGWAFIATKVARGVVTSFWRRPHPWRVMLEGRGSTAARMFDAMADGDPSMALAQIAEDVAALRVEVGRVREYAQWTYRATQ